jgi:hypothetical protein
VDLERFYRSVEKKMLVSGRLKHLFERPTSNIEHRMMNSLAQRRRLRRVSLGHFIKKFSMPYSKFDVGRWMFDVPILFVLTVASLI